MPLSTGQVINQRYRIVRLLGQGGFGAVYRAWDLNLEAPVAVKENLDASPEAQQQFKREAQILFSLSHPNLPRVMDHFVIQGQGQYLVMEFVEGDDLQTWLIQQSSPAGQSSPQPPLIGSGNVNEAVGWIIQICDALSYLHHHTPPVIHRDIKPSNIKITPQGKAMLVDFGIAKIYDPHLATTKGARAITPGYSPPEQYGQAPTDAQSDVYALSATLYTLLTGQIPPPSVDLLSGASALPGASQLNPSVPAALSSAITAAMQLDRTWRTRSVTVFRQALVAASQSPQPPQPPGQYPAQPYPGTTAGAAYTPLPQDPTRAPAQPPSTARTIVAPGLDAGLPAQYQAAPVPGAPPITPPTKVDSLRTITHSRFFWPVVGGIAGLVALVVIVSLLTGGPKKDTGKTTRTPKSSAGISSTRTADAAEPVSGSSGAASRFEPLPVNPIPQPESSISADNAGSVVELAHFGRGHIFEVDYSPDGSLAAAASSLGVYIFNASTLQLERFIDTGYLTYSVDFSPDGRTLAAGLVNNSVKLYRVSNGRLVRPFVGHSDAVNVVQFSPDGKYLAAGSDDNTIIIWQVSDGSPSVTLSGHTEPVWGLAYSADGSRLASASHDDTARLWEADSGNSMQVFTGHTDDVWSVDITPDGSKVVTGSADNTLKVWDAASGGLQATLEGHNDAIYNVDISPDGKLAASGSSDRSIRLWDLASNSTVRSMEDIESAVATIEFDPDGKRLLSGAANGDIYLWQVDDGSLLESSPGYSASYYSIAFSPDGKMLASGDGLGKIHLINVIDGIPINLLDGHSDTVWGLSFSPDGAWLASASSDTTVRLWDVNTGVELWKFESGTEDVFSVAFSPAGDTIAAASSDGSIHFLNPTDGQLIDTLAGEGELSLAWAPDGAYLASGSTDNQVHYWDIAKRTLIAKWPGHTDAVYSVAYSLDGAWVGSASADKTVRIWRTDLGGLVYTLEGHTDAIENVAFSPDSSLLSSAADDNNIIMWRVSPGEMLSTLEGHTGSVFSLAFSQDGRFLASASEDGTIRLWGVM